MHGHGLRGIFDRANRREPAANGKWVVRIAMARRDADDALLIPLDDGVEQDHASRMRDARGDLVAIQLRGFSHSESVSPKVPAKKDSFRKLPVIPA